MVKRLATSPHDPIGITDSACKNQSVMVSVQYGPFNTYIPIRSTTIGKSRVARDPITMHTSRRSNSDIACVTRVLNERTVHRYVVNNDKLGGEKVVEAPKVKRTPTKKKGVSNKRPAAGDAEVAPIVKKKRTTKGKPVAAKRLPVEEQVDVSTPSEQPVAEVVTGEQEPVRGLRIASINEATTGDADAAIEQVLAQLDLVIQDLDVEKGDRVETWFDRAFDEEFETANQENQDSKDEIDFVIDNQELPVFDQTRKVPEAGGSKNFGVDQAERDLYYASLPRISIHDKVKEKLEEDEPARETVELICGDVDFLVQLRNKTPHPNHQQAHWLNFWLIEEVLRGYDTLRERAWT
ncbi:adenylate isopentenyltransferase 5, chloroplastic-like [Dorcoceras hygrometricum]|uniref:Adenylate isopentenyltransferase 5, chloroplastic-like n=1 Tax=Dorcoceras hygrometricum TaxID=472368 RepID=A0A2Z7AQ06_9LAMI|nr:adenylate isopentenyltransferase 5, chloroplastic-like [Dorcoceras hygrometricum]